MARNPTEKLLEIRVISNVKIFPSRKIGIWPNSKCVPTSFQVFPQICQIFKVSFTTIDMSESIRKSQHGFGQIKEQRRRSRLRIVTNQIYTLKRQHRQHQKGSFLKDMKRLSHEKDFLTLGSMQGPDHSNNLSKSTAKSNFGPLSHFYLRFLSNPNFLTIIIIIIIIIPITNNNNQLDV